jgi:O-antigen/teichoic acid export membrane protein
MNSPDWKEINERILVYVTLLLVFIGFAVSVSIKEILIVLAPAGPFREAAAIVPLMVLGHIFYVLYYVVDVSFFVLKKTIWYVVINFTAAVATVVLNVLLIPHFGYTAAAYVSAASFLICPALALAISQRYCRLDYDYVRLAKIFIVGGSLFAVSTLIDTGSFAFDVALKSVLIAGFPAALLVIGFADKKEIEFLRRRLKRTSA